jgi:DNA-binding NarL/FixJ family response regulator
MTCESLTDRQREVAQLVAEGYTDKVIAAKLGTTNKTVRYHVGRIVDALQLDRSRDVRILIARRVLLPCTA